ncbi:ATP synthase subunit delta [Lactococcus hodotermopsidis]|uniref:ATP synthase subunit delta n=1 Tax=Pseudolactococcus hodotermopsidis TaxID=2709157 RepID=A0A6A0BB57_9LACT|nr:F0F1 ATP synthase subunit delta [Lactococcus hodotermopsidis]GFH41691.1 ATP synthase subunit delta [Lactococcus hodotermopsidis]
MSLIIAQKYSKALLEVAESQKQLAPILVEVAVFEKVFQTTDLASFLADVAYNDDKKIQVIRSLQGMSSDLFNHFLETIIKNKRVVLLPMIMKEIRNQADQIFKISTVTVTSVVALSNEQLSKLEIKLKAKFGLKDVKITNYIDETILGGLIIKARGKIIDTSLKTQLDIIAKSII